MYPLLAALQPAPSIESALSAAFPEANASLKKRPGLDADLSGSTGIVALLHQSRLVAANLGDSRCVLGACCFVDRMLLWFCCKRSTVFGGVRHCTDRHKSVAL